MAGMPGWNQSRSGATLARILGGLGGLLGLLWLGLTWALAPKPPTGQLPKDLKLPPNRRFELSLTYQPPDWNPAAFQATYDFIHQNAEWIAHFSDDGIPWDHALMGGPYPKELTEELAQRARARRPGQKCLLAVNPVSSSRYLPALLWTSTGAKELPQPWSERGFDSEEIFRAYTAWLRFQVETFRPDLLIYAFEVNSVLPERPKAERTQFLAFLTRVEGWLRAEFPGLPLALEVVLGDEAWMKDRWVFTEALAERADVVGVSSYPYLYDSVVANQGRIPADWFLRLPKRIPGKAWAVTETGFLGADFLHPKLGRWIPGRGKVLILGEESVQAQYLADLFDQAQAGGAQLVNWWVWKDLDRLWEKIGDQAQFQDPLWGQWNHTGLIDAEGRARSSWRLWQAWKALPRSPTGGAPVPPR